MIRPMETIVRTHHPTWGDIIQLPVSLLSTEERHRILTEARKWFREMGPEGTANPQRWENQPPLVRGPGGAVTQRKGEPCKPAVVGKPVTPGERPNWGCDTEEGRALQTCSGGKTSHPR